MLRVYHGRDGERHYTRTWVACDQCFAEGEPVLSIGEGTPADVVQAMYGSSFTVVGDRVLCQACRAGAMGAA